MGVFLRLPAQLARASAGHGEHGNSTVQKIEITGGYVTAISNTYGAGIGSAIGQEGLSSVGNITITNGVIVANGFDGAGIGSGYGEFGNSIVSLVSITGGRFTATGFEAAGIGAGYARDGNSSVTTLTIGGNATGIAFSVGNGAGVGSGYGFHGTSSITTLTIGGAADFEAFAYEDAAGIGAANGWLGQSLVHNLYINGGQLRAYGHHGAGIGAGYDRIGNSTVDNLVVRNGNLLVSGVTGIGSDPWGQVKRLEIDGTEAGVINVDCYASSHFCFNASVLVARSAYITATTNTSTFIDPDYHTGTTFDNLHLVGFYSVPSQKDHFGSARALHFGQIDGRAAGTNTLELESPGLVSRNIPFNGSHVVGVIVALTNPATYNASLWLPSGEKVHLCVNGSNDYRFVVNNGEAYYAVAAPCGTNVPSSGLSGGTIAAITVPIVSVVVIGAVIGVLVFLGIITLPCRGGGGGGGGTTGELIDSKADSPYTSDGI